MSMLGWDCGRGFMQVQAVLLGHLLAGSAAAVPSLQRLCMIWGSRRAGCLCLSSPSCVGAPTGRHLQQCCAS